MTRLVRAKVVSTRYDLDKGSFRLELHAAEWRRAGLAVEPSSQPPAILDEAIVPPKPRSDLTENGPIPNVECEIRCDSDVWSTSLELVIDPPPQSVSCLRRHRLSSGGGGSWITIEHDAVVLGEEHVVVIVRRGPSVGKDKYLFTVNGSKVRVDVEDLPEDEVKKLAKMKRVQPTRIPLDQPPALGPSRRRERSADPPTSPSTPDSPNTVRAAPTFGPSLVSLTGRYASPLTRLFYPSSADETTSPASTVVPPSSSVAPSSLGPPAPRPAQVALDALDSLRLLHSQARDPGSWILVSDKDGLLVQKRIFPSISTAHSVHRTSRVFQGSTPEEIIAVVSAGGSRKLWDDRIDTVSPLEVYANGVCSSFITASCTFPFRDRGFFIASATARADNCLEHAAPIAGGITSTIFHVSSSFASDSATAFDPLKLNPYALPIGTQIIEGWVLEVRFSLSSSFTSFLTADDGSDPSL